MIKHVFLLSIVCLALNSNTAEAQAQSTFQQEWAVGVSGGVTLSSVSFKPTVKQNMLLGATGGVALRWITEKNLGVQLEFNYTQQGWKEKFEIPDNYENPEEYPDYRYIRRTSFIEMPFLTHIYFGNGRANFFVNLGPQIGYLLSEKTDENLGGATPNKMNDQHNMLIEKKFEWGICGGPGIEIRTGIGYFLLEGRYFYSLGDFYNTHKGDVFSKASTQVITARLSYLIPFH